MIDLKFCRYKQVGLKLPEPVGSIENFMYCSLVVETNRTIQAVIMRFCPYEAKLRIDIKFSYQAPLFIIHNIYPN